MAFDPFLEIAASAGSGKTFQLSYRMLRLLAMGVSTESVGAFTFSRKAAGEIFDSVVHALRKAAASPENAGAASNHIGLPREADAFLRDLRNLLEHLPFLHVGTLDAHIARLLGAVSIELGLPPDFALLDDQSEEQVRLRRQVMTTLFRAGGVHAEHADTFFQLFQEATHGRNSKEFLRPVLGFVEQYRAAYRAYPRAAAWEGPTLAKPPMKLTSGQAAERADEVRSALADLEIAAGAAESLTEFAEACAAYDAGSVWSRDVNLRTAEKQVLAGGDSVLVYRKKATDLAGPAWDGLQALVEHVCAIEWEVCQRRTRAVGTILAAFDAAYQQQALPGGRLTFDDACDLMAEIDHVAPAELAYRLDGEIDHWLLDEFQDTSRAQWRVLEPFLDEILQDPEQRRSLFIVGDVKQAIYGWRGGDATLFEDLRSEWPQIVSRSMATSYRSASPVLDLVNAVFDGMSGAEGVPPSVATRWDTAFEPHRPANRDLSGRAEIRQVPPRGPDMETMVMEHLRTLPPEADTALLVRTNDESDAWALRLREEGFRVSQEGTSPLRNCTAVEVVLAGLRHAVHPADRLSRNLLRLAGLPIPGVPLLSRIQREGIASGIRHLVRSLPLEKDAAYARSRLALLEAQAVEFDLRQEPDVDRFLEHVDRLSLREAGGEGIRIMTIHQCKGLGFDAVVVPIQPRVGITGRPDRGGLAVSPPGTEPAWVTVLPPSGVCQRIPELREVRARAEEAGCYETLCVLYVALTRAKRSMLMVLPPPTDTPTVLGNWIPARLREAGIPEPPDPGVLARWETGEWTASFNREPPGPRQAPLFPLGAGRPSTPRLEPSRAEAAPRRIDREFLFAAEDGRELGSRVHGALERLEFVEGTCDAFLSRIGMDPREEAASHLHTAWTMPELRRPEGVTGLWREQKFESLLPEGWITGIFDRVVVFENHAWIQDYKTNRTVTGATIDHYRPQMALYRKVLADMLDLDPANIACHLLFTRTGQVAGV